MQEQSIYHILLAWMGSDASADALEETLPHNNVVKRAVADLRSKRGIASNVQSLHSMLSAAQAARAKLEEEIGPERVHQQVTISVTTHGNRVVETPAPGGSEPQAQVD